MNGDDNYLLTTGDGTSTLFLKEYDQAMHSDSGAYEESLLKHVFPSGVLGRREAALNVLDVGFGLGYNVLALIHEFRKLERVPQIRIVSLERERYLLGYMENIRFNDERDDIYGFIKDVYKSGRGESGSVIMEILFGEGREFLKKMHGIKFHAVFQDPFSPSKNPEMWSVDYFSVIAGLMEEDAVLTTYSSADQVRRAMLEAGFIIGKGPSVGKKREGTVAAKTAVIEGLEKNRIDEIWRNPRSVPYRDPGLTAARGDILSERLAEIKAARIR